MGAKIQRTYSIAEKENAITIVCKTGSLSIASRKTGIPLTTIHTWIHQQDSGELEAIRTTTRTQVVQRIWEATFKVMLKVHEAIDDLKLDPDKLNPGMVSELARTAEYMSRALKNIGAVATQHEVHGAVDHMIKDGRPLTIERLQEVGAEEYARRRITGPKAN